MTTVQVRIPPQLAREFGAQRWETVEAETVGELVVALDTRFTGFSQHLLEQDGRVCGWINIFIDERDIRSLEGMATRLRPGVKVYIVPAIGGGAGVVLPVFTEAARPSAARFQP